MSRLQKLVYLLAAAVGLMGSFQAYNLVLDNSRDYYLNAATSSGTFVGATFGIDCVWVDNGSDQVHYDMVAFLRQLEGRSAVSRDEESFFIRTAAIVGFLDFLLIYFVCMVATVTLVGVVPPSLKKAVLILCSAGFLFVALPARAALLLLAFAAVIYFFWRIPLPPRARACLIALQLVTFYCTVGGAIVSVCSTTFFTPSRLTVPLDADQLKPVNDFLRGLHMGILNAPVEDRCSGFPYLLIALGVLLKLFRRLLWVIHELWTGRGEDRADGDFLVYLIGMPWLIGESATPSFRGFVRSAGRPPDSVEGARTLAWCLGFCSLAYTVLVMLGTSPAVRAFLPRSVWAQLALTLVVQYLFLMSTSQASIGVARIFGYGLRDNFDRPLLAPDPVEFWRRWNIHWREFLVSVFYYPTLLALARRAGRQRRWHLFTAAVITFLGTAALNLLPLILLSWNAPGPGTGPAPDDTTRVVRDAKSRPAPSWERVQWRAIAPSLLVFNLAEAAVVGGLLAFRLGRPRRRPGRLQLAAGVAVTFLLMAALRVFLDMSMPLSEQLELLRRALGAGP